MKTHLSLVAIIGIACCQPADAARFVSLGTLPMGSSRATDVSADGKIVVGTGNYGLGTGMGGDSAFRWTEETGIQFLVDGPDKGLLREATAISPDGQVVVGTLDGVGSNYAPFKWTADGGLVPIPPRLAPPRATNYDGSVIVGGPPDSGSGPSGISWNGSVTVGTTWAEGWRDLNGVRTWLGDLPSGSFNSAANAISGDGTVIVGQSFAAQVYEGQIYDQPRPAYWSDATGMVGLGQSAVGIATDVSHTGLVIVGEGLSEFVPSKDNEAFRWTPARGLQSVRQLLLDEGIDVAAMGLKLSGDDVSVSANGRIIVGTALNAQFTEIAWLAEINVPGDFDADGFSDGNDFLFWQRELGAAYAASDLEDWKANLNFYEGVRGPIPASTATVVPEPSAMAWALPAIAIAWLLPFTRKRLHAMNQGVSLVVAAIALSLTGCGGGEGTPSTIPLPAEYRVLAEQLAFVMKPSREEFRDDKGTAEILAEGHSAVMALRGIKSNDSDISYIAAQGLTAYSELVSRLERLNALPKPPSVASVMTESFIHGLYGNVNAGYAIGSAADEKQKAIFAEIESLLAIVEKAEAVETLLSSVAEKYAATQSVPSDRIRVDIDAAWGWVGPHDWFCVYNAGPAIEDCTIEVQLKGGTGQSRKNMHFVRSWPAKTWMYARYEPGEEILGRQVGRTSVDQIQAAYISLWSPQYSTSFTYSYTGAEKYRDVEKICKSLSFTGTYRPYSKGLVWDDQRAVVFTLGGSAAIPKCSVNIAFRRGTESKVWTWEQDSWEKGETKTFEPGKENLGFDPEQIDMEISFPDTSYRHKVTLKVNS